MCVEGPKSCGKTWFCYNGAESVFLMADPTNNFQNRRLADVDLSAVFKGEQPHLIDEWQEVPEIWDAAKLMVDEGNKKGMFILTGSSTPRKKGIMHSGAGRIGSMRLRTMSLYESGDSDGSVSLSDLFNTGIDTKLTGEMELSRLVYLTVRGGWPNLLGMSIKAASVAMRGYVDLIIEDAATLDGIMRDRTKIRMALRSLARNESPLASLSTISSGMTDSEKKDSDAFKAEKIATDKTVADYIDVFDRLFLISNQTAYSPNIKSPLRVGKTPKRHLIDPALSLAALGVDPERLCMDTDVFGYYFEALCERDLAIYAEYIGGKLYHYRDHSDHEVDAIVELPDGRFGAFEIKLGAKEIDDAANNLLDIVEMWRRNGAKTLPTVLCVICGMTNAAYRRPDGVYVAPITSLRP
ncbi:MAG: ATP-binding protein [Candidatus Methanomethylophilaceae archaeon]|nr:ATP-binding protein [Candidatus Methanomethylophilaceae archaeon]